MNAHVRVAVLGASANSAVTLLTMTLLLAADGADSVPAPKPQPASMESRERPPASSRSADELESRIRQLIRDLDSERYANRKAAEEELGRLGRTALEPVREATRSASIEASQRAQRVLRRIEEQIRIESIIDQQPPAEKLAVVVLDNCDPNYQGAGPHGDGVTFLGMDGKPRFRSAGFNNCEAIGINHGVAVDPARARIYVREMVPSRIAAFDPNGTLVFEKRGLDVSAVAVDPETGHLWCAGGPALGPALGDGHITVIDPQGQVGVVHQQVAAVHQQAGFDICWSPRDKSFWLAGKQLTKLDRSGRVLFQSPPAKWAYVSVAAEAQHGGVWVLERQHSQVQESRNQLLRFDSSGKLLRTVSIDGMLPMQVACHPTTGEVWVVLRRTGVLRLSADGETKQTLNVSAEGMAIGPRTGSVWIALTDRVIRVDDQGRTVAEYARKSATSQCWLAAY